MRFSKQVRVAVIQSSPVLFDKKASLDKSLSLIEKASRHKPDLIVFPESFIPAYPRHLIFGSKIGSRSTSGRELWNKYYSNSVDINGEEISLLASSAAENDAFISIGITERDGKSLYCTQAFISPTLGMVGKHRKIKPTAAERIVWGEGDGSSLTSFKISDAIIGTLICWENYMPHARMALYEKGVNIYIAPTADNRPGWQNTLKHIALEGRCFVIGANQFVMKEDYPDDILMLDNVEIEKDIVSEGGSTIISPFGEYIVEPVWNKEDILIADLDLEEVVRASLDFDPAGHYNRPDIFEFRVKDQPETKENIF